MRWPYDRRAEPTHAWGVIGAGVLILVTMPLIFEGLHMPGGRFRWWWPSNWMIVPCAFIVFGLVLLVLPLRRSQPATPIPQPTSTVRGGSLIDSNLGVDSSAEHVLDGTEVTRSSISGRHFPGRPDLLNWPVRLNRGQEGPDQAGAQGEDGSI